LPAALLPPLPHVPALLPVDGARPVPRASGRTGGSGGIEEIQAYVPQLALPLPALAAARGVAPEKMTQGLGVQAMALTPPCEDVVKLAATAASRCLRAANVDPRSIGLLIVATETAVDHAKPVGIFVHEL